MVSETVSIVCVVMGLNVREDVSTNIMVTLCEKAAKGADGTLCK